MVQQVNVTVDNVSPLITYTPPEAWHEGDTSDPYLSQYYNGTYTQTTQFGAYATLSFNGTIVTIYGAKRPNHALYNVSLDGQLFFDNGQSSVPSFQQALFTAPNLSTTTTHNVSLIDPSSNPVPSYLDLDFIIYQVEIPDGYEWSKQQDTHKAFRYSSSSEWNTNPQNLSNYSGGNGHITSSDAYVVYTFEGAHVEIYGAVGPSFGAYTIQVDDGTPVSFNATNIDLIPQTLLFQDNSFTPGTHTLKISNSPFTGQSLSIDFAVIYTLHPDSSSLGGGAIGGIAVGACATLLLILFGMFFWWRRRHRQPAQTSTEAAKPAISTGPVIFHTPSLPTVTGRQQTSDASATPDPSLLHPTSTFNSTPSPPHSNSSVSNTDSRSRLILHNPTPSFGSSGHDGPQGSLQEVLAASENTVPPQNPGNVPRPLPQPGRSNPPASSSTFVLAPAIPGDLRAVRLQVEGRSQDFGPVTFIPDPEHDGNTLPPDYNQATQPFPSRQP